MGKFSPKKVEPPVPRRARGGGWAGGGWVGGAGLGWCGRVGAQLEKNSQ